MSETLYPSNIDIYYPSGAGWVNASGTEVAIGDTGVTAFLQFTIPAATIPTGQRVKSAKLYVKNSLANTTLSFVGAISGTYRFTTTPATTLQDNVLLQNEVYAEIDISNVYADFSGVESICYLNIDSPDASTQIYTDNADSGDVPYIVVEYESVGSVVKYDDGAEFANKEIHYDDGTAFTRMNAYYDNGTDFVLMG